MLNLFKNLEKHPTLTVSPADYDDLVRALALRASRGASWDQILIYLRNRGLTPDQVAQWMTKYGGKWVNQPEPEFGSGLWQLSQVAEGELAAIAATLGRAIAEKTQTELPQPIPPQTPEPIDRQRREAEPNNPDLAPDPHVLAEIEAYLRGDFSLTDPKLPLPGQTLLR